MNSAERSLLLVWFLVVLAVLVTQVSVVFGVLGVGAGVFLGLPVARTRLLGGRPAADLVRRRGVRLQRVGATVAAHVVLLVGLVLVAALVPGLRDGFVALFGGALTAGAATVTAARLRRR